MLTLVPVMRVGLALLVQTEHPDEAAQQVNLAVPVRQADGWQLLRYRRIPPNEFQFASEGLEITIHSSAGPAIYPLKKPARIRAIRASGKIFGTLRVPAGKQGEKHFDDYALRLGLVEAGTRTLSFYERTTAPDWVRKLFSLAPKGAGISRVHFFNLGTDATQIGRERDHPTNQIIRERTVAVPGADGRFAFTYRLDRDIQTVAVWISCDGDDTRSDFKVTLEKLELEQAPASE